MVEVDTWGTDCLTVFFVDFMRSGLPEAYR